MQNVNRLETRNDTKCKKKNLIIENDSLLTLSVYITNIYIISLSENECLISLIASDNYCQQAKMNRQHLHFAVRMFTMPKQLSNLHYRPNTYYE